MSLHSTCHRPAQAYHRLHSSNPDRALVMSAGDIVKSTVVPIVGERTRSLCIPASESAPEYHGLWRQASPAAHAASFVECRTVPCMQVVLLPRSCSLRHLKPYSRPGTEAQLGSALRPSPVLFPAHHTLPCLLHRFTSVSEQGTWDVAACYGTPGAPWCFEVCHSWCRQR